jgi:probable phosphoglycerate mutase
MTVPLLALRHGPTDWNARKLIQGRADTKLSAVGRRLVRKLRLPAGWENAACITSPLSRASETARILGLSARQDARLIEMDWGDWEGQSLADLRAAHGEEMANNEARGLDFRPPGGESPREVQARVATLLSELDAPTLIITHKGVLRAIYALATGWTMQTKPPAKLRDGCAHVFAVGRDGALTIEKLNVPLA